MGCGGPSVPAEDVEAGATVDAPIQVRLALNWYPEPEFGGFYEGVAGGHYAAAGFDVEIIPGGPGAPTLEQLTSGRVEAAITVADDLLVKRQKGVQALGVWAAFQLSPLGLMVHKEGGLRSFGDFAGQTGQKVAIEAGSPFQTFLWKSFPWEGQVELVPYSGSVGPFLADKNLSQQAYITSEPCVAESKGASVHFIDAADSGWNPYGVVLALADPMPAWGPAFVDATHRSWTAYLADPAAGNAAIAAGNDQLSPPLIDCIFAAQRRFIEGSAGLGHMAPERWAATAAALVELGLMPPGSTADGAWIAPKTGG